MGRAQLAERLATVPRGWPTAAAIGAGLQRLRIASGMTQRQLVECAGWRTGGSSALSRIEAGARFPTLDQLFRALLALGVDVAAFFRSIASVDPVALMAADGEAYALAHRIRGLPAATADEVRAYVRFRADGVRRQRRAGGGRRAAVGRPWRSSDASLPRL